jgi:hypothetical protein
LIYNIHLHFRQSVDQIEMLLIDAASNDASWTPFANEVYDRLRASSLALGIDVKEVA